MKTIALSLILFFAWFGECFANQATVTWEPPWLNTDGTPCTDLAGFRLPMGTSSGTYLKTFDIGMGLETTIPCTTNPTPGCFRREFTVSGLAPDTYYVVVTAYDTSGNESAPSNEVSKAFASDGTLPGDVLNFTATPYLSGARLSWTNPMDPDLAQVVIEYRLSNTGFANLATVTAIPGMPQTYDHLDLAPGSYVYAIHTRDTSGNTTHTAYAEAAVGGIQPVTAPSGGKGGCFIATAAYGSYLDPHVVTLRKFRDEHLLTNAPGRLLVAGYYATCPPIADFIARDEWAREATQVALAPIVFTVLRPMEALIFFTLLTFVSVTLVFVLKRKP